MIHKITITYQELKTWRCLQPPTLMVSHWIIFQCSIVDIERKLPKLWFLLKYLRLSQKLLYNIYNSIIIIEFRVQYKYMRNPKTYSILIRDSFTIKWHTLRHLHSLELINFVILESILYAHWGLAKTDSFVTSHFTSAKKYMDEDAWWHPCFIYFRMKTRVSWERNYFHVYCSLTATVTPVRDTGGHLDLCKQSYIFNVCFIADCNVIMNDDVRHFSMHAFCFMINTT